MSQLSLNITLDQEATFDNFYAPQTSTQHIAVSSLKEKTHKLIFLSGLSGTGLSHLLQAACHCQTNAIYLPLTEMVNASPDDILDRLEYSKMVCLDDVHSVISHSSWQHSLFNFYNRCLENGARMVFSSHIRIDSLGVVMPDLISRFKSGLILHLWDYREGDLLYLLKHRAGRRGLNLPEEVIVFILNRLTRSTRTLMEVLDVLDEASMRTQRRITLPFVKETLEL